MPLYFFETDDGDFRHEDDQGIELPNIDAARIEALDTLPEMARNQRPYRDRRTFSVLVRDASGAIVYSASLDLVGQRHGPPASS